MQDLESIKASSWALLRRWETTLTRSLAVLGALWIATWLLICGLAVFDVLLWYVGALG